MFYATRVEAINNGSVTDSQGKILSFIGDLPVKVGDVVYTDGKVVFGHAPKRGSVFLPDEDPTGVPVLSEDLRGYFTVNGKYQKYKIAGEEWITNAKRTYRHDQDGKSTVVEEEEQNDNVGKEDDDKKEKILKEEILDAEIVIDEETGTENGVYIAKKIIKKVPDEDSKDSEENDDAEGCKEDEHGVLS